MTKLWLDDVRSIPDTSWDWVKTAPDAITFLTWHHVDVISLDFDLGDRPGYRAGTGLDVARFLMTMDEDRRPRVIMLHTMNPVGRILMARTLGILRGGCS